MDSWEKKFLVARQVITFILGVFVIFEAVFAQHNPVAEYIIGTILLGLISIEDILTGKIRSKILNGRRDNGG